MSGVFWGLSGLLVGLLSGCHEVPLSNQNGQPNADGGTPTDDGGTTPAWRWESPLPQGNDLRTLWGIPGSTADQDQLYAGGSNGTLLTGGSAGWQLARQGDDTRQAQPAILAISGQGTGGSSPQALAVGVFDLALRRSGSQWVDISPQLGGSVGGALNAVWATSAAGEYYVAGTNGRIYHVLGSGASWAAEGVGITSDALFSLTGAGSGSTAELYAVGDNGRVLHRVNNRWAVEAETLSSSQLNAVWLGDSTSGEVFAVGNGGAVLHKQGGIWKVESTGGINANLNAVWGAGSDVYAAGSAGTILHRQGGTWQREATGLTNELLATLWGTVRNGRITLYAAGNVGTLLRFDSGTWQSLSSRVTDTSLRGVWARSPGEVYAVGGDGLILRRSGTAAQGSWLPVASGLTGQSLNAVTGWSASPTNGEADVWAVGSAGTILHKTGTIWGIEGGYLTNQELTGVWAGPDSVYVVGRGGRIYHKTQGSWNIETGPMGIPVSNDLTAVWGIGSGATEVVYVVGNQGLVLRHDTHGWTAEAKGLTSASVTALFGAGEEGLVAALSDGTALRRMSGQWQQSTLIGAPYVGVAGCVLPGTADLLVITLQDFIARQSSASGWRGEPLLTLLPYNGVAAAALNDNYIVGSSGLILHRY